MIHMCDTGITANLPLSDQLRIFRTRIGIVQSAVHPQIISVPVPPPGVAADSDPYAGQSKLSFDAVHELQDLFFHSSQYTMPFKILHYKSFFLSSCAVKTCFRAISIRHNFIFSDILCESQRRAYDKSCNM